MDTIEGGLKGRFDGRLVADFSGYYNKFKNFQIFSGKPPATTLLINVPEAEMWGGELQ